MAPSIRRARPSDLSQIADLLIADAEQRQLTNPVLWSLAENAREKVEGVVRTSLAGANLSMRQLWLVAETSGRLVGITHSMRVPVPPIYEGDGPGLFLDDCFTTEEAPPGMAEAMLEATEAALRDDGAKSLVASCLANAPWRSLFEGHSYRPVTLYMMVKG